MRREAFLARAGGAIAGLVLGRGIEFPPEVPVAPNFAPTGSAKLIPYELRVMIDGVDLSDHVRSISVGDVEGFSLETWADGRVSDRIEAYP